MQPVHPHSQISAFVIHYMKIMAPLIDIPMFNIKYLAMHKVQMHTGAISKLLHGFASVRVINHLLSSGIYAQTIQ